MLRRTGVLPSPASAVSRLAHHADDRTRQLRPNLADLFLAAAPAALRRLGQSGSAAAFAGARGPRPLPQLGLGGHRAAPRLARAGTGFARPWRQPVVARRQLFDRGLCLRPGTTDPSAGTGASNHCRAFAGWQPRDPLCRRLPGESAPSRRHRRTGIVAAADGSAARRSDRRAHAEMDPGRARAVRPAAAPLCHD